MAMRGSAAIVAGVCGEGRVVLISPHLEAPSSKAGRLFNRSNRPARNRAPSRCCTVSHSVPAPQFCNNSIPDTRAFFNSLVQFASDGCPWAGVKAPPSETAAAGGEQQQEGGGEGGEAEDWAEKAVAARMVIAAVGGGMLMDEEDEMKCA